MTGIGSIPRSYFDKRNSVDCDRATTPSNRSPYFRQRIRISLIADISSQLTPRVTSDCSPSSMKFDSHRFLFRRDQIPSPYVLEIRSQANFTERKNYNERSHLCIIIRTSTSFFESSPPRTCLHPRRIKRRKSRLIRLIPHHRFNFCAHAAEHVKRDDTNARISFVPGGHSCERSHVIARKSYSPVWPPFTESATQLGAIDYHKAGDIRASNVAFQNLPSLQARESSFPRRDIYEHARSVSDGRTRQMIIASDII